MRVEPSVFGCIAGKAVTIGVAGHAVVGAVLAEGSGLPLDHQREQAFLKAGIVSAQVVPLSTASAEGRSYAGGTLRRTEHTNGASDIKIAWSWDAS